ncbi:MAG: hypothetical protein AAF704_19075 [Cyanobacteria bacterium P01_D01_bin.123]
MKPTSPFKYVFATVLGLTILSGGMAFYLAGQSPLTESQDRIFDSAIAMWTMGTAALISPLGSYADKDSGE